MKKVGATPTYRLEDPIDVWYVHEYGIDIHNRELWLVPEKDLAQVTEGEEPGVEYIMTSRFLKNLNILVNLSNEPILVHMKTNGGVWEEGMAIYDAIKSCPCAITILSYTHARSMSSLIFSAADKRVMMPHSKFMFHEGTMAINGTVKQYRTEGLELEKAHDQMMNIYIDVMKRDSKLWKNKTRKACKDWLEEQMNQKEEVYLNAKQSIQHGFCDDMFDGNWDKLTEYTDEQLTRYAGK